VRKPPLPSGASEWCAGTPSWASVRCLLLDQAWAGAGSGLASEESPSVAGSGPGLAGHDCGLRMCASGLSVSGCAVFCRVHVSWCHGSVQVAS